MTKQISTAEFLQLLQFGTLATEGLLPWSSNYTFLVRVCPNTAVQERVSPASWPALKEVQAVYKPRRGERPLWDFAQGTLCYREQAAFLVSEALGWGLIPPTVVRDGPHGLGSLQLFVKHDPERHYFTFEGNPALSDQLQKIVLLDIIINNADRKGGHVLVDESAGLSRLWAIDHGICFHTEHKLRTVIWEFAGNPVPPALLADLRALAERLDSGNGAIRQQLQQLLTRAEVAAMQTRLQQVLERETFLKPGPGRHYPWPPV